MKTIDLKKELSFYKTKEGQMDIVTLPSFKYLMIDGIGDPNTSADYVKCIEALYALAYTIKFDSKKEDNDFVVMPLEGQWYVDDMKLFDASKKDEWKWTLLILMPDFVSDKQIEKCKKIAFDKKGNTKINDVRFEEFNEGLCLQTLYMGAYKDETETINNMHVYLKEQGYELTGKHHEIYMNDPRKMDETKLKTIIRQPIKKA